MAPLGQLTVNSSPDDVAEAIIKETIARGYTRDESIACDSTLRQESGLRMVWDSSKRWFGYAQQDASYSDRMDPNGNLRGFLNRLDVKRKSAGASPDIWKNIFWLQQRPGEPTADIAYANGRKAYLTEIKQHVAQATADYEKYSGGGVVVPDNRPDFNEYSIWSPNYSSRGGVKPTMFLLHTQEGDGNADSLAKYFTSASQVSYHYTISKGANDDGVTVVDCVDTDYGSWSVGNANSVSINLCFAGSKASWSREQWLVKAGRAIDVAAYLAVQDAKKYGFSTLVVPPPYTNGKPGISDHQWVTKVFGWGTHTDVGPNFPWDALTASVAKYLGAAVPETPAGFTYPSTDVMIREIWEQLRGPQGKGWPQLGQNANGQNLSLVDAIAELKAAA